MITFISHSCLCFYSYGGGYSVRISVERSPVKIKEDKKNNGKTAIILPSLSRAREPDINFVPVFRLGDRIDNPAPLGSPIKTKNIMIDTAMSDLGSTNKFNSISLQYIRMNQSMLQKVRLGIDYIVKLIYEIFVYILATKIRIII